MVGPSLEGYVDTDNLYWLFSSAAQSLAALVGLLVTGLALVQAMMENAEQKDDTLTEIHARLQASYYRWLKPLIISSPEEPQKPSSQPPGKPDHR